MAVYKLAVTVAIKDTKGKYHFDKPLYKHKKLAKWYTKRGKTFYRVYYNKNSKYYYVKNKSF